MISIKNLLEAWKEFEKGKKKKYDVQEFSLRLMDNIFSLHFDLFNHTYETGGYQAFKINDSKPRDIHKATVRDRLLHHAIYRKLYPFFAKTFISDSYSCQNNKGTHKAVNKFRKYYYKVSQNNTRTCWALKCDIKKFFANIDHEILLKILAEYIPDENILWLSGEVVGSFPSVIPIKTGIQSEHIIDTLDSRLRGNDKSVGLPLGNLTSQLFVNIYMNKFDQFVKHKLKAKYYIRYADDFVILSENKEWMESLIPDISKFLKSKLKLKMHPDKISIKTFFSGMDFLGVVNFTDHRILRTKTKRRMIRRLSLKYKMWQENLVLKEKFNQSLQSYIGILSHVNGNKIEQGIRNRFSY
jgi:retron-type reverse transcriptase